MIHIYFIKKKIIINLTIGNQLEKPFWYKYTTMFFYKFKINQNFNENSVLIVEDIQYIGKYKCLLKVLPIIMFSETLPTCHFKK